MSDPAGTRMIERRASQLEALSSAFFEQGKAKKLIRDRKGVAEEPKHTNPLEKAGKESFSPAATWMKPLVRGLNRFSRGNRNHELVRGVGRFSRSEMYHKRGLWAVKAKNGGALPTHPKAVVKQVAEKRDPKFYPAHAVTKPLHRNSVNNAPKLRANITPGTVLILLAGHLKGKRVVFLKQLDGGLLLVTGPFKVNGVPLRRVSQSYVISTSTKIKIGHIDLEKFNDAYFKREVVKKRKGERQFFEAKEEELNEQLSEERKSDQILVDTHLILIIDEYGWNVNGVSGIVLRVPLGQSRPKLRSRSRTVKGKRGTSPVEPLNFVEQSQAFRMNVLHDNSRRPYLAVKGSMASQHSKCRSDYSAVRFWY